LRLATQKQEKRQMRYGVSDAKVAWRVVDGEAVLLHSETSGYFGLNWTGTVLWGALAEHAMTPEELAEWARLHLPSAPAEIANDITGFVDRLVELDLLEPNAAGQAAAAEPAGLPEAGAATDLPEYEPPEVVQFGELEKLILSGE
jgi:hypothetical protein